MKGSRANTLWGESGIFENYLSAKQTNDSWPRILSALDWLDFHGQINSTIRGDQEFALFPYLAYAFPPFYTLFASHTAKRVENSKADYEVRPGCSLVAVALRADKIL